MKSTIAALFIATSACAETIMIPVQDLLFEVPNFATAPAFDFNAALNGNFVPDNPKKADRKTKRELERRLIDFMWEKYPDAASIRIWNGTLIIRIP